MLGLTPVDSDVHCQIDLPCHGSGGSPADAGDRIPVMALITPHALHRQPGTPGGQSAASDRIARLARVLCFQAGIADGAKRASG